MRFPSADIVATWPEPNSVGTIEHGPRLMVTYFVLLPFTVGLVGLRLWVRAKLDRKLWWDDWCMVGALVFAVGVTACVELATARYGWTMHIWDLSPGVAKSSRQVSIAGQGLFIGASGLTKMSVLTSYLRVATNKTFLYGVYVSMVICLLWLIVFTVVLWTQCIPISSYWAVGNSTTATTTRGCVAQGPPLMAQSILATATDTLVYVLLPTPLLWLLRLPIKQRVGVVVLLGLGVLVSVAGMMRTYHAHRVAYETKDTTWAGYDLWIWTGLETDLAVIGGSLAALKALLFGGETPRQRAQGGKGTRNSSSSSTAFQSTTTKTTTKPRTKTSEEAQIPLQNWWDGEAQIGPSPVRDGLIRPTPLRRTLSTTTVVGKNTWVPPSSWRHQRAEVDVDRSTSAEAQRPAGQAGRPLPLLDEI